MHPRAERRTPGFSTRLVHAGQTRNAYHAVAMPIVETASFTVDSMDDYERVTKDLSRVPAYSRGFNPTVGALEENLAALEMSERALAFGSGMSAIHTLLSHVLRHGGHLIASKDVFPTTRLLLSQNLPELGFEVSDAELTDPTVLESLIRENTRAVFVEAFTNPELKVLDLEAMSAICRPKGILLVVDNTFLSPYLLRPLEHGADVVVHSTTKYIAGHGRVLGGAVLGSEELLEPLAELRRRMGTIATPHSASSILDGVKTLAVRQDRQCATAQRLAEEVAAHPAVEKVNYPGLPHHPGHQLARRLVGTRFGGVFSFALHDMAVTKAKVFDAFELIVRATSLGDVATLVDCFSQPELLRISVGLEDEEDLLADLRQALDGAAARG
jgi:methionine-gamma-lyase